MTQEEKAKAYDELFVKVKQIYNKENDVLILHTIEDLFPELKESESEDERIRKSLIDWFSDTHAADDFRGIAWERIVAWLEKQKVSINKVEPKFKVGDWIVFNGLILHIDEIVNGYYRTTSIGGIHNSYDWDIDNVARLWTIQDAKPGDVLVYGKDKRPFIFKGLLDKFYPNRTIAYCGIDESDTFEINTGCGWWTDEEVYPATEEQCYVLFQNIKEAGYEWDSNKKELKKIENEHICELDNLYTCVKFPFKAKVKSSGAIVTIHGGQLSDDGKEWIKYQSDAEDGYKVYEPNNLELVCEIKQKPAWSEEDERYLSYAIYAVEDMLGNNGKNTVTWLKSLKDRYPWKPSDEQLYALNKVKLIRAEIERRLEKLSPDFMDYYDYDAAKAGELESILFFIDSLEENPKDNVGKEENQNKELENEIVYLSKIYPEVSFAKLSRIAVHMVKWQRKRENDSLN